MREKIKKLWDLKELIKRKDLLCLALAILAVVAGLLYLHQFSYNSDDVAEQTMVQSIKERGLRDTWLPPDPWLLKLPLYFIVEEIIPTNRLQILIESVIMNVFLVFCVFVAAHYFYKKIKTKKSEISHQWIWFAWVFSISYGFLGFLRMPNARNFELGLLLLTIVLGCMFYFKEISIKNNKHKLLVILGLVLTAINFYSDPYFFVFLTAFFGVFLAFEFFTKKIVWEKAFYIVSFIGVSLIGYVVIKIALDKLGFHVNETPLTIVKITEIPQRLWFSLEGLLFIFAVELPLPFDNFGRVFVRSLNQTLGIAGLLACLLVIVRKKSSNLEKALAAQPFLIQIAYVLLNSVYHIATARYLLLLPLYYILVIPLALRSFSWPFRKALFDVVMLITVINILSSGIGAVQVISGREPLSDLVKTTMNNDARNRKEGAIIQELKSRGLTKGYGHYWETLIINFLSDYETQIGQIICDDNKRVRPYYWVVQDEIYIPSNDRSFLIFNSKNLNHRACDIAIFGPYSEVINIDNQTVIFVYEYDVASKFPAKDTLSKPD